MDVPGAAPLLLPSSSDKLAYPLDDVFGRSYSETASARTSTHGSDGIFDHRPLRSPINGSESEYEDEDDLISEMPMESAVPSCYGGEEREDEFTQYQPSRTNRSPFRNPSSVRGMQLDTTPPHLRSSTRESLNKHYSRLSMGSRNSTPRSVRSHRSGSPTKTKITPVVKKETPLVLLHVTVLPISCPYSQRVLEDVAPQHLIQNWKLLREKVPDTVLERGILIPHPREEYEMLEERLLESLELAVPKILKCGHYHCSTVEDHESEPVVQTLSDEPVDDDNDSDADSDICVDCTRRVRDGTKGSAGKGKRRWNICIYAANGLMRAGAWAAAWKEMERVDVEISPWMEDGLRQELDLRRVQEKEEDARLIAEKREKDAMGNTQHSSTGSDEQRLREIYGDNFDPLYTERNFTPGDIVEAYEHGPAHLSEQDYFNQSNPTEYNQRTQSPSPTAAIQSTIKISKRRSTLQQQQHKDISTSKLLLNYIKLLLQDQRNIALAILSIVVLWLALQPSQIASTTPSQILQSTASSLAKSTTDVLGTSSIPTPSTIPESVLSAGDSLLGTLVDKVAAAVPTPNH
ncbi:MAG: hypothetical protein GOMPHAMPRED_004833 [Gomphillus americanus]|uniref:Pathway-specific nitrogen regulator n=1 Tax=Gomphillus americanus TaxID=1940652 RepID=A0A8H3EJT3_9LECA|nr:MAG: hypothetical protein GOMPHAMPRED_004833 [Gomphillus americanus]